MKIKRLKPVFLSLAFGPSGLTKLDLIFLMSAESNYSSNQIFFLMVRNESFEIVKKIIPAVKSPGAFSPQKTFNHRSI